MMTLQPDLISSSLLTLGVIFLAEVGDKSQLVCMTLASRYRTKPVIFGAICAFALLNLLAVILGASLTLLVPEKWLTLFAAALFGLFGIQALLSKEESESEESKPKRSRNIFITTFVMIFLAELGDKTQLAVVTLSTTYSPIAVWISSTLALTATSAMGVFVGRKFLAKMNVQLIHRVSGGLFIVMACLMLYRLF